MTAVDARHERHMMRQRGAGARSIPTNFGFIFHAGPIQVSDIAALESLSPANAPPIAIAHTQSHPIPESSLPTQAPAPKRKRVVREEEEDGQIWFKKRTKKTTAQEQKEHAILTTTSDTALDVTQEEPPTDKEPAKRKVVRKRVLVPRPRNNESFKPRPDQSISLPEPVVEDLAPSNKKRTKTPVVSKQTLRHPNTLDAPSLDHGGEDELSNHSIHTVSVTESAPPKKMKSSRNTQDECMIEKRQRKAVPRKNPVRKHTQESVETKNPSLKTRTQITTTLPQEEETIDNKPQAKTPGKQKETIKHPEKLAEQPAIEAPVGAQLDSAHETNPLPKKKKLVRRVRVPRTTTKRPTAEQDESVCMVNKDDTKSSVSPDDIDPVLLEAVAPAPLAQKSSKNLKRIFFNDDSDIDLDQMLNGIAAIAGTERDTKTSASKSNRISRRKVAV